MPDGAVDDCGTAVFVTFSIPECYDSVADPTDINAIKKTSDPSFLW